MRARARRARSAARGPTTTPRRSSGSTCSTPPRCIRERGGVDRRAAARSSSACSTACIARVREHVPWRPGARELLAELNAARRAVRAGDDVVAAPRRRGRRGSSPPSTFQAVDHRRQVSQRQAPPRAVPAGRRRARRRPRRLRGDRGLADRRRVGRRPPAAWSWPCPTSCRSTPAPARDRSAHARRASRSSDLGEFVDDHAAALGDAVTGRRRRRRPTPRRGPPPGAARSAVALARRVAVAARRSSAPACGGSPSATTHAAAPARRRSTCTRGRRTGRSTTPLPDARRRTADALHEVSPFWYRATGVDTIERRPDTPAERRPSEFIDTARDRGVPLVAVDPRRHRRRARWRRSSPTRDARAATSTPSPTFAAEGDFARHRPRLRAVRLRRRPRHVGDDAAELGGVRRASSAERLHADGRTLTVSIPPVYDDRPDRRQRYWVYDYGGHRAARRRHPHHGLRLLDRSSRARSPRSTGSTRIIDGADRGRRRTRRSWCSASRCTAATGSVGDDRHVPRRRAEGDTAGRPRHGRRSDRPARRHAGATTPTTGEWSFTYELDVTDGDHVVHAAPRGALRRRRRGPACGCSSPSTPACAACRCSPSATRTTRVWTTSPRSHATARHDRRRRRPATAAAD